MFIYRFGKSNKVLYKITAQGCLLTVFVNKSQCEEFNNFALRFEKMSPGRCSILRVGEGFYHQEMGHRGEKEYDQASKTEHFHFEFNKFLTSQDITYFLSWLAPAFPRSITKPVIACIMQSYQDYSNSISPIDFFRNLPLCAKLTGFKFMEVIDEMESYKRIAA